MNHTLRSCLDNPPGDAFGRQFPQGLGAMGHAMRHEAALLARESGLPVGIAADFRPLRPSERHAPWRTENPLRQAARIKGPAPAPDGWDARVRAFISEGEARGAFTFAACHWTLFSHLHEAFLAWCAARELGVLHVTPFSSLLFRDARLARTRRQGESGVLGIVIDWEKL